MQYGSIALAILLVVAFIKILTWMPVKTPLITVAVTDYSAPFPPNAWASEDVDEFGKAWESQSTSWWRALYFGQRENNVAVTPIKADWQSPQHAITTLGEVLRSKQAQPAGPGDTGVVLIYLSAHGMLDSEGKPCLLLGGAPDDEVINAPFKDRVLKLSDVLSEIGKSFPAEANKVLFLDANRIDSCWPLGILYNGFAESLDQTVRGSQIDNLYVLNSTSTGTVGRASPKLQASLFAHHLTQGLQHGSDQDRDGKISLFELWKYVEAKVSEQTGRDWLESQSPILLPTTLHGKAKNVLIAWHRKTPLEPKSPPPAWDTAINRDELGRLWQKHAQLRPWSTPIADATETPPPALRQPVSRRWLASWEAFQQGLIRYEQLLRAGKAYQKPADQLKSYIDALVKALETTTPAENCVAHSLPLAEMYSPPVDPKGVEAANAWLDTPPKTDAAKSDNLPLAAENAERAIAAWNWVLADAKPSRIKRAIELLDDGKDLEPRTYIETHFLRLLGPNLRLLPDSIAGDTEFLQHAFECRQAAEIAAIAAGDERIHYFVRNAVQAADSVRRQAEDRMFVGNPTDRQKTLREFQEAKRQFTEASQRANALAQVFDTRDRGAAQLPYLAAWLSRRPAAAVTDEARHEMLQQLDDALARHRELVEQLDVLARSNKSAEGESAPDARLSKLADDCATDLQTLEKFYSGAVTEVIEGASDGQNLREIEALLSVPLVTGELRAGAGSGGLFNIMVKMLNEEKPIATGSVTKKATAPAALERPLYMRWAGSEKHPHPTWQLLELSPKKDLSDDAAIEPAAPAADESVVTPEMLSDAMGSLAKQGSAVQNKLALASGEVEETLKRIAEATDPQPQAIRQARANGVRIARRVMPFLALPCRFGDPEKEVFYETQRLLQQFDQQQLMAWHAERTLDDFWGPATVEKSESYFVGVAKDYLKAAGQPENDPAAILPGLEKRLASCVAAAESPVEITPNTDWLDDASKMLTSKVTTKPNHAAPSGTAAIYVVEGIGEKPTKIQVNNSGDDVERFAFNVNEAGKLSADKDEGVTDSLRIPIELTADTRLAVKALYRAHPVVRELTIVRPEVTRETVWMPPTLGPPSLAVAGEANQGSLVFVLDCSGSMKDNRKMKAARDALKEILLTLAQQTRSYQASLWLYGHRCSNEKNQRGWNDQWTPDLTIVPSNDVQRVVEPMLLNSKTLKEFTKHFNAQDTKGFDKVRAFGLTPLHLAMIRAAGDFERNGTGVNRMIVITDGLNNVAPTAGATPNWVPTPDVSADEVRNTLSNSGIHVSMLAFMIDASGTQKLRDLVEVPPVKGNVEPIENTDELITNLKQSLGIYSVNVVRQGPRQAARQLEPMVVGEVIPLDKPHIHTKDEYSAVLAGQPESTGARFVVEADEKINLFLEKKAGGSLALVYHHQDFGRQAKPFPMKVGSPGKHTDLDFDPASFHVSVLPSQKAASEVPFRIAVQNGTSERFSPRPAEYWVQITPLVQDESQTPSEFEPYWFYDRMFEPEQMVPVISCVARNWPPAADAADISLFFKMHATRHRDPLRIREVKNLGGPPDDQLTLSLGEGRTAKFAVDVRGNSDSWQVIVRESHDGEEQDLALAKVVLSPTPNRITRRYFSAEKRIEHRFAYQGVDRDEIDNFEIAIISREDLQNDSVDFSRPLRVKVK